MHGWDEIRRWRNEQREDLNARRLAIPQAERRRLQPLILDLVERQFPELADGLVGFYWPFRGEVGVLPLVRRLIERGARATLPVVVEKGRPLEFRAWQPGDPLERGVWDIPVPANGKIVRPTALLLPLLGFDAAGYRLGYGGGYYDRTLAAMNPKPLTIGIGYELGRLATIHPQPHDVPMEALVTEAGLFDEDPNSMSGYASPPCFMHELGPDYVGLEPERPSSPPAPADAAGSEGDGGDR